MKVLVMKYKTVENCLIIPAINDFKGYGRFIHGVIVDEKEIADEFLTLTRHGNSLLKKDLRSEFISEQKNIEKGKKGTYLYLGVMPSHFGHLLAEGAHRLWISKYYKELQVDGFIALRDEKGDKFSPKLLEMLSYFNIDFNAVHFAEDITKVDKLVLPQPGSTIGSNPVNGYNQFLEKGTKFEKLDTKSKPKKIFVSRNNFKKVGRVAGFDYIANILTRNGYFEFKPEKYPLIAQLEYLKAAEQIIWEEGSAIHLLDILPKLKSKMLLIRRRPDYAEFDQIIKNKSNSHDVYSNVSFIESNSVPHNRMSRLNNVAEFFKYLEFNKVNIEPKDLELFIREESIDIQEQLFRDLKKVLKP